MPNSILEMGDFINDMKNLSPGNEDLFTQQDLDDVVKQDEEKIDDKISIPIDTELDEYLALKDTYLPVEFNTLSNTNVDKDIFLKCPVYIKRNEEGDLFIEAYVTGIISDISDYVNLLEVLSIMTKKDHCIIYLDSPGGYVATGAHVSSCIDVCEGTVITVARGFCASAASLIWSHGHKCYFDYNFAVFMYHMSSHVDMGNSYAILNRAENMVDYVKSTLLQLPKAKGHITEEEMNDICSNRRNIFIDAETMLKRLNNKNTVKQDEVV